MRGRIGSSFLWRYLAIALLSVVPEARADIFCQPPSGPIQNEWREAGAAFLDGIAQTVTGLARIEGGDITSAQSEIAKADASLRKTAELYQRIVSRIPTPRAIDLRKVSPARLRIMEGFFEHSDPRIPTDERQAALAASEEAQRLVQGLERIQEALRGNKLGEEPRALLNQVARTLQLGNILTEVMKAGLE